MNHYYQRSPQLAADLVNSLGAVSGNDTLDSTEALLAFLARRAEPWTGAFPVPSDLDLERVKALRRTLREVFEAVDEKEAATLLNSILATNGALPRVVSHGDHLGFHFEPPDAALNQWLGVVTGMGLAMLVADEGLTRLGVCASDSCGDVFIDTSRNRSRRHCTTTCGTRENVAAYRRRQRGERKSSSA